MKYHSKGINKNKKIREQRKFPLPLMARMTDEELKRIRIIRRRDIEDKINSKNIQLPIHEDI